MSANGQQKPITHGITGPLSTQFPDQKELELNEALLVELKRNNNFETTEDTQKRVNTLNTIQKVVNAFVKLVAKNKGMSPNAVNEASGRVFTYGSYRLGVYGPGSDIDTLLVAPKFVSREDFFDHFPKLLEEMSVQGAIEEIKAVPDAFVPIIKLEYSGISIDLIFSRLTLSTLPANLDLKDNELLRGLNDTEMRCLNGTRVTDEMLNLVPQVKTFRHALRGIKLWAQRRAIYANVMGFPGGVAWALMVARICQMYPQASGAKVIVKFFYLMSRWRWPEPIMLKLIEPGPFASRVWNPAINRSDKNHLMPIITPAFPSMCATHNITHSTQAVIKKELERGREITEKIFDSKLPWSNLFERHQFFSTEYKYYLNINSASRTNEAQLIWSGLVESKVRRLVSGIEMAQLGIELARPFTKGFSRVHECSSEQQIDEVLQGSLKYQAKDTKTETTESINDVSHQAAAEGNADKMGIPQKDGSDTASQSMAMLSESVVPTTNGTTSPKSQLIHTTSYYIGLELGEASRSLDISNCTREFVRQCKEWPQFNENTNSVRVVFTRNYDLPDDVFEDGESRPLRKASKKTKSRVPSNGSKDIAAKKRSFSAVNAEDVEENGKRQHTG